jgi:hypothetical protein
MTKTKRAVKEVNKMADNELLKQAIKSIKLDAIKWLNVEVYGYKRKSILLVAAGFILAIALTQ